METAEESDDDEEDPISKKYKKRKRKGKPDSLKKINMVNPWNVDSESRYITSFNRKYKFIFKYKHFLVYLIM
jgi:hypothetical protein